MKAENCENKPVEDGRLSNPTVPDQQQLEQQIVLPLGHLGMDANCYANGISNQLIVFMFVNNVDVACRYLGYVWLGITNVSQSKYIQ